MLHILFLAAVAGATSGAIHGIAGSKIMSNNLDSSAPTERKNGQRQREQERRAWAILPLKAKISHILHVNVDGWIIGAFGLALLIAFLL